MNDTTSPGFSRTGLAVVLVGVFAFALSRAGAEDAGKAELRLLDGREFHPSSLSVQQRRDLMAAWARSTQTRPATREQLRKVCARLGDDSHAVREAATAELLAFGPEHLDTVAAIAAAQDDAEVRDRADWVIAQWKLQLGRRPIRLQNACALWGSLPNEESLRYTRLLVKRIRRLPEFVTLPPDDRQGRRGPYGDGGLLGEPKRRIRDRLLREIAAMLASFRSPKARVILRSFLHEGSQALTLRIIQLIGSPSTDPDVADDLLRLAEGPDKAVAIRALSHLSNWHGRSRARDRITPVLKRLYNHADPDVALQAAIISCYSGDGSGFSRLLEATASPSRQIAMKAIGQLGDCRFSGRAAQVIPRLLPHLKTDDVQVLDRTIETLGNYPGAVKHVIPFLEHEDKQIVRRAILALNSMGAGAVEAVPALKRLRAEGTDDATLGLVRQALEYIARESGR